MRIKKLFKMAKEERRQLFIPYLTCGDPDLATTESIVEELSNIGADIVELGVPFNDPIADGPTNQMAAERALKNSITLNDCCLLVKRLRAKHCVTPIILYTYFNPVYKFGVQKFAQFAKACGIDAVLIVDLPLLESQEIVAIFKQYQIGFVSIITPTTTHSRIKSNANLQPEFLYYVSRTGVTGASASLAANLAEKVNLIRSITALPIAVGFGISNKEQVRDVSKLADSVVVGSALVQEMEGTDPIHCKQQLLSLAKDLITVLRDKHTC